MFSSLPIARHRFIERHGRIIHLVTYLPDGDPITDITEVDRARGMSDAELRRLATELGCEVEKQTAPLS
jgi:predicted transcriptional regulator